MRTERVYYLDLIRILACIMVITMHAPMPGIGTPGYVLAGISFITAPCIGLFFMVSGALLLPVKQPMGAFYRRRLSKVIWPTLFWTCFYIVVSLIQGKASIEEMPKVLLSIPFSAQGHGILWFMYTLIGLYLLAPVLSPWLERATKSELVFVLGLWGVTLLYGLLSKWLFINESPQGVLYSFSGYAGYFLLGYYLHKYKPRIHWAILLLMMIIPIIVVGIVEVAEFEIDFYRVFWYLSIFVVSMAIVWFTIIRDKMNGIKLSPPLKSIVELTSNLSFGIYLVHIFIMRSALWKMGMMSSLPGTVQILLTVVLTFILSFVLSWLISLLPIGKYIIGYQYK